MSIQIAASDAADHFVQKKVNKWNILIVIGDANPFEMENMVLTQKSTHWNPKASVRRVTKK